MIDAVLDGIVVLDFGQLVAGPVCGMWLADMGATVIKVEPPEGELGRQLGPPWQNGESIAALSANRNKMGLSIDLKQPGAPAVMERLVRGTDIVLENFRPGVARRLGIDDVTLRGWKPDLIHCSISAYGQEGPWRGRPGVDGIMQAATGLMSGIGLPGAEPGKAPLPLADMTGALFATITILAALRRRDREGVGSKLDVSLYNAMLMIQQMSLAAFLSSGDMPVPAGSAAPYAAPNEALPTADGWIMVAAYQPKRWAGLCRAVCHPELLDDPRFLTNADRVANRAALREVLFPVFRAFPTGYWQALLAREDIIAAPVANYADVTRSEQYTASGIEVAFEHPTAGTVRMPGFAAGSPRPAPPRSAPPRLGEHSRGVLGRFGFTPAEIDPLIRERIVLETTPT
ncbi:CoA transferase [Pseudoroseomonas wenyumeiae]|uniref:CoA transferase n=2 Tax=Teichococcus wenyumeiae TaxID=2478470 RepID=A0A3A9JPG8_9PROT|nr:CoA transferase [Pseudoroseomonas wenyumeiae]RKK02548.1 CoA transferase [Pseudoroseomonas wenyumeiae]RMI15335.1 CoA transferase [Pseudoroseomonas wenyumeiae]